MATYTRNTLTGSLAPVNNELEKIEQALSDKLDRNPSSGQVNQLENNLDVNSKRLTNLGAPDNPNDAARLKDITLATGNSVLPVQAGQANKVLSTDGEGSFWKSGVPFYVDTFAVLSASSPSEGDVLICKERANSKYIVQASGYVALTGDVTFLNSLVGKLQVKDSIDIRAFGEITNIDDSALFETALNSGRSNKYTFNGQAKIIDSVVCNLSDTELDLTGAVLDCTELTYTLLSREDAAICFKGAAKGATTLTSNVAKGAKTINVTSVASIAVGDIIRLRSDEVLYNNASVVAECFDVNRVSGIDGLVVSLDYPVPNSFDNDSFPVALESNTTIRNCSLIGGEFIGGGITETPLANGLGQAAIFLYGVDNFSIKNSIIKNFHGIACSTERCIDGVFENIDMFGRDYDYTPVEGVNSGWYGVYPIRSRNIKTIRCNGVRLRHTCDATDCISIQQISNTSSDSHKAAFGSHEAVYDIKILNNVCLSGSAAIIFRAFDGIISGNTLDATVALTTAIMNTGEVAGKFIITNNTINTSDSSFSMTISGCYSLLSISNNKVESVGTSLLLNAKDIRNTSIKNNTLITSVSGFIMDGNQEVVNNLTISNNEVYGYTGNAFALRGALNPSAPAKNIKVSNNTLFPLFESAGAGIQFRAEGYYGDGTIISGNTCWDDSSVIIQLIDLGVFSSHPIVEQNDQYPKLSTNRVVWDNASATLSDRTTVFRGSIINRTSSASANPSSWTVTGEGTYGAVVGVTGSITAGTDILTLVGNDATKILSGYFIVVDGSGVAAANKTYRVVSISDDFATCTLSLNADTTVAGAAVSLRNPTTASTSILS